MKEEKGKKKEKRKKSTLAENIELTEQNRKLTEKLSYTNQINQLIKGKYNRLVQALKKVLKDAKKGDNGEGNKYKQLMEKLGNLIDEINNPQEQKLFFTPIEDLRKAELKIN